MITAAPSCERSPLFDGHEERVALLASVVHHGIDKRVVLGQVSGTALGQAATVVDPDGVMVELLNRGRLSLMKD